ncbi:6-phosphogluconolactonase [Corynebacterium sp. CCM 8835]|uniref:6-phosphogluconolactonase n=1 Tax=Corynebacterium antarcticum TaxID=2800405 RepID=A0ABS1FKI5_9CORY|nr:6-phosphogluconolactonase [Corynebacterium antarcticum]MCK7641469.1 6-phosphogluconolactonase [Corynebacterium antarcticum]MCK7660433.1 6-phosphogluconolactonase [Corynebacterium antarcticum]MCL0244697.1 6-phosphogluconolactonase [Corynebacterium antarcticum]MCX7491070.1 6-phosphogluconolactonase [Corynebacterium antarcticum]
MVEIARVRDLDSLVAAAAARMTQTIAAVQAGGGLHGDGVARVVLTGGGAGIGLLRKLAEFDATARTMSDDFPVVHIDWSRVHVFFGDERNVDVSHPESNEGQARAALLDHVDIDDANIHGYGLGGRDLDSAVEDARRDLRTFAPGGFDLHLLGMGGEGHINSIFPHTPAVREDEDLVTAVTDSPKPPAERVTLTLPAIRSADRVWLLVAGAEKAEAARAVIDGAAAEDWPAAGARGRSETVLFLDDAAAGPDL